VFRVLDGARSKTEAMERARAIRSRHPYGSHQWNRWHDVVWFLGEVIRLERENGGPITLRSDR
jgi:hypothetical protein